jgi:hypothetical protein
MRPYLFENKPNKYSLLRQRQQQPCKSPAKSCKADCFLQNAFALLLLALLCFAFISFSFVFFALLFFALWDYCCINAGLSDINAG